MSVVLYVIAASFWGLLLYYTLLTFCGILFRAKTSRMSPRTLAQYPSVTVLIPAHNEGKVISDTLAAMVQLEYPGELTICLLNDNSSDETGQIAEAFAAAFPHVHHIQVPPGAPKGKSRVLNYGLSLANTDYIAVYDADNQPEPDALRLLIEAAETTEHAVGAVGFVKTINADKNVLTRMIALEFAVFQLLMQCGRWFLCRLGSLTGTNLVVKRDVLLKVGGWDPYALAEDADLTITLTSAGGLLPVVPESRTWEQEPETYSVWLRQRTRWMQGNLYLIGKTLRTPSWFRGRALLHTVQLLTVYIGFLFFLSVSDVWFILGLLGVIKVHLSTPLLLLWFESWLLYVVQLIGALATDGAVSVPNLATAFAMYFSYAQFWLYLLARGCVNQYRLWRARTEPVWEKTIRF